MPLWANDNAYLFWKYGDRYERKNGAVYREFEGALPAELSSEQLIELVKDFINAVAPHKPYEVAIHAPLAALGGVPQPHFHLMTSDRVDDGIERPPEQHFRRFNSLAPHLGGCRKESGGKTPLELSDSLRSVRAVLAEVINKHLMRHGHIARVDHRSNRDRGLPEPVDRHLGPYLARLSTTGTL